MTQIKFGTDGWRAVIGEDFTFANLDRAVQATADEWKGSASNGAEKKIIVGYDRRFLSNEFAERVSAVFAGNGYRVILSHAPVPTPSVSFAVKRAGAVGGVMITASHNPPIFNGYKLKADYGGSADSALCKKVEERLDKTPVAATVFCDAVKAGQIHVEDLRAPHLNAIKKLVDFKLIARSKLRFAHECLYGVGAGCFDYLLRGTTCRVTSLDAIHDPNFGGINPEPVAQNYGPSSAFLKKHPHDLCLVTDGDADRVGAMDGHGRPLTTHNVICLLLHHYIVNRQRKGRVIKALTTTSMVDKMCAHYGLELVETGVGFKYICAEMLRGNVLLGFEESGGIGFPELMPERDGIAAGMMLLELLATERVSVNKLLAQLEKQFGPHHYARLDTHFPLEKRAALMEFCQKNPPAKLAGSPVERLLTFDGVKMIAKDGSWLMLRGSGTEPILRIYAESKTPAAAQKLIRDGVALTKRV
jgi:phosphomannomutase